MYFLGCLGFYLFVYGHVWLPALAVIQPPIRRALRLQATGALPEAGAPSTPHRLAFPTCSLPSSGSVSIS